MALDLRPMRAGELLDRTFSTLRDQFRLFAGIAAVPMIAGLLLRFLVLPWHLSLPMARDRHFVLLSNLYTWNFLLILMPLAIGASAWAVSRLALGERVTIWDAYRQMLRRVPSLIGSNFLYYCAVIGVLTPVVMGAVISIVVTRFGTGRVAIGWTLAGLLGLVGIILALWILAGMALALPAVVLEKIGPLTSLQRSWSLSKGGRWRILMVYALYLVIGLVVKSIFTFPFSIPAFFMLRHGTVPPWLMLASSIFGTVAAILVLPLLAIGLSLEYINQRVQKEAFDLQVMLGSLEAQAAGAAQQFAPLAGMEPPTGE